MANRYWIGGAGNWSDPEHWSDSSGGIPYKPVNGVEKITNIDDREFNIDTGWWVKGVGGTISNGKYNYSCIGTEPTLDRILKRSIVLEYNKWYKVTVTLNITSGSVLLKTQNGNNFVYMTNGGICINGVNVFYIYQQSPGNLGIGFMYYGTNPNGTIDNVSIIEVDTISPDIETDCIFDNNSGAGTVTVNAIANMRNCTFAQTRLITLTNSAYAFNIFGNWTLCSNTYLATSFTGTGYVYLKATTSVNITSNGCTRAWNRLYFDGVGGTWTNQDNMNIENSATYISKGTWSTNNKTISFNSIVNSASDIVFTINFGSSIIDAGNGIIFPESLPNLIINAGTSIINISGDWCSGAWKNYNTINYTKGTYPNAGVANFICNNFYHKNINSFSTISGNFIVNNSLVFEGDNSTTKRTFIASHVIGVPRTITCNGTITASNVDFRDIVGAGTANWDLSAITGGSGDCGGNSGITFTPTQKQYFKHTLGAVNWSDATKWFSNYERTIQGRVPLPQDDATFDATSFTGASTLSVNCPRIGRSLDMSAVNQAVGFALANHIECYGNISISSHIISIASSYTITGRGKNIYLDIKTTLNVTYMVGRLTTFTLLNDFTSTKNIYFDNWDYYGYDFNDYNVTVNELMLLGLGAGTGLTRKLGNGTHTLNSHICYLHPADFEGSTVIVNNTLSNCDNAQYNILELKNSNTINMGTAYAPITIKELRLTAGKIYTLKSTVDPRQVFHIGKLTAIGTPEQPITIRSTVTGQRHTINYTGSEASTVEYCNILDSNVTEARRLLAKNSVNGGNNQNWGFDTLPALTLNKKQVDKIYIGDKLVTAIYKGTAKIY